LPRCGGALASRPALDRLFVATASNDVDVVIVFALDRLGCDAGHLRDLLRAFDAAGVEVHAAGAKLDRVTPEGRMMTGILAEFAEMERAKISQRWSRHDHDMRVSGRLGGDVRRVAAA